MKCRAVPTANRRKAAGCTECRSGERRQLRSARATREQGGTCSATTVNLRVSSAEAQLLRNWLEQLSQEKVVCDARRHVLGEEPGAKLRRMQRDGRRAGVCEGNAAGLSHRTAARRRRHDAPVGKCKRSSALKMSQEAMNKQAIDADSCQNDLTTDRWASSVPHPSHAKSCLLALRRHACE